MSCATKVPIAPIRKWRAGKREPRLKARHQQHGANGDHHYRRDITEDVGIEADRIADRRGKQSDEDERDSKPSGERD